MNVKLILRFCSALLLTSSFWGTHLAAQKLDFERLSSDLGLSQNLIKCLIQDSKGFLWVGTKDGLNRFDGYHFTTFRYDPFDSLSLSGNDIYSILEDRNGRIWVANDKGINLFDKEQEVFYALKTPISDGHLTEDPQGNIWQGGTVKCQFSLLKISLPPADRNLDNVKTEVIGNDVLTEKPFYEPIWDAAGRGFVGLDGGKMYRLQLDSVRQTYQITRNFDDLHDPLLREVLEKANDDNGHFPERFKKGRNGRVWMSCMRQLFYWDAQTGKCTAIEVPNEFFDTPLNKRWNVLKSSLEDEHGRLWLGGFHGTFRIDVARSQIACVSPDSTETTDPLYNGAGALLEDKGGLIWVGTRGYGLLKFNENARRFTAPDNAPGLWKGESLRALYKTTDGRVWLGTTAGGVYWLDQRNNKLEPVSTTETFFGEKLAYVYCFYQDRNGALWLGSDHWGLAKITGWQSGKPKFEVFSIDAAAPYHSLYNPKKIIGDASQNLWMVSKDGLRRFNPQTKTVEKFLFWQQTAEKLGNDFPTLFQDRRGRIWVGNCEGLWRFDADKKTFQKFRNDRKDPKSLSHDLVKCIAEDPLQPDRLLWIGTGGGGLNLFDTETGVFEKFTEKDGLPDMVVYSILPDEAGNLWLSTNKGISVFDPKSRKFRNFDQRDGLQHLEFNTLAYQRAADGQLLFGGIEGFNAFYPARMLQANKHVPSIVFTDFKISNQSVSHKTPGSPLTTSIAYTQKIVLPADVKIISFEFAALDFAEPSKNQFSCKMEGFDPDWRYLGTVHSATYTNLNPGTYTFRVRGTNNDGVWNEEGASIEIVILSPWWATWWAYALYVLIFGVVSYAFYQIQRKRSEEKAETRRLQDLNEAKSEFLSTVSHELRTPLTSIMGFSKIIKNRMEERILPKLDHTDPKTDRTATQIMDNLDIVIGESERLSTLINEVLDLAKIESGKVVWHEEMIDMGQTIEQAMAAMTNLYEQKGIELHKNIDPDLPKTMGDPDRLYQVILNLLSNALKFTEKGTVTCSVRQQNAHTLLIGIADTGIGIPEASYGLVFEKFGQVTSDTLTDKPQGTGLGLPICKEIIEHYGGRIWVESEAGKGSAFFFTLRVDNASKT